jgi:hypothetical protein
MGTDDNLTELANASITAGRTQSRTTREKRARTVRETPVVSSAKAIMLRNGFTDESGGVYKSRDSGYGVICKNGTVDIFWAYISEDAEAMERVRKAITRTIPGKQVAVDIEGIITATGVTCIAKLKPAKPEYVIAVMARLKPSIDGVAGKAFGLPWHTGFTGAYKSIADRYK